MTAKIAPFIHFCTEKHCGGIVLEDHGRVKKIQKVGLTIEGGGIRTFDTREKALIYAERYGIEVQE